MLVLPFFFAVLGVLYATVFPRYRATSVFAADASSAIPSSLAGAAANLGISIPAEGSSESPDFYASLLDSRDILAEAAATSFAFPKNEGSTDSVVGTYVDIVRARGATPEDRLQAAVTHLDKAVTAVSDLRAGTVTIEIVAPWPDLAEQMNRRLLDLVDSFNIAKRRTRASAERSFLEARVDSARVGLDAAEVNLQDFLENNRTLDSSARLRMKAARLQRAIDLARDLYTTLRSSYERARLDEVRNTPVITILEHPDGSVKRVGGRLLSGAVGLVAGAVVAFVGIVLFEATARLRQDDPVTFALLQGTRRRLLGAIRRRRAG